jgi:hypothetical protein
LRSLRETAASLLPSGHPDAWTIQQNLAVSLLRAGDSEAAAEASAQLARLLRAAILPMAATESTRDVEVRAASYGRHVSWLLAHGAGYGIRPADPRMDLEAFACIEALRGIAHTRTRFQRDADGDPTLALLRDRLLEATAELARRASSAPDRAAFEQAFDAQVRAQRDLQAAIARSHVQAALEEPTAASLAAHLAPDQTAVGYWRYARGALKADNPSSGEEVVDSLLAFILTPTGELHRVELGPIAPIEAAVVAWRDSILAVSAGSSVRGLTSRSGQPAESLSEGDVVRRLVFDPLRPFLGERQRLVVALDDVLHLVPLDALPLDGGITGDTCVIELRLTLRELLEDGARSPILPSRPEAGPGHLAIIGNVAFPEDSGFRALPGTLAEIDAIAALWTEAMGEAAPVIRMTEEAASHAALAASGADARVLHVATHGWSAPADAAASARSPHEAVGFASHEATAGVRMLSPMLMCGLVLAGDHGARAGEPASDGIVTAEELAMLDLRRCELAVLSACETGRGIHRAGQGVASLQKALHLAGARTSLASLWAVPDHATRAFMIEFYRRLWLEGLPCGSALREAKQSMRSEGHPLAHWSGWVMTGEQQWPMR